MKSPFQFFKHAQVYRLSRDIGSMFDVSGSDGVTQLHDQLSQYLFTPCGPQDCARTGWKNTDGVPDIVQRTSDILITVVREVRNIPHAALKAELDTRYAAFEDKLQRKPKKPERDAIRDEVFHALLPRAFPVRRETQIWIDMESHRIVVDASTPKGAEDALALLRKSTGSLPVVPLTLENPIELTMTNWLKEAQLPAGIDLSDKHNEARFEALLSEGGKVSYRKQDILSEATTCLLDEGHVVTSLGVRVGGRVDLVLTDSGQLKKLVFADELTEQNDDIDMEDQLARRYADFTLMADELRTAINKLIVDLGGEAKR
ncbi:TPA: recombination-associated protein RdgC [Enterobacter cloacae]